MEKYNFEYLYKLAFTDLQTGLKNRNAYEEKLSELRAEPAKLENLNVAIIDINELREINNNFGHSCGDEAIKTVAACILAVFGDDDFCARIGGDEFIVFLYSEYEEKIDKFKNMIKNETLNKKYKLAVSIGVSSYSKDKSSGIDDLVKSSDEKMYANKKALKGN